MAKLINLDLFILDRMLDGRTISDIADELNLKKSAVHTRVHAIRQSFNVMDITKIVIWYGEWITEDI